MRVVLGVALVGLVVCVGCGSSKSPHPQEKAIAAIEALGGAAEIDENGTVVRVGFYEGTKVTDAGLVHLKGLTSLQYLGISDNTKITDAGLVHLKGLTELQSLNLGLTKVTDAGLAHLKGLTSLKKLWLYNTKVTAAGVKQLQQALPNCKIDH